jgi:hypothetical protein
LVFKQNQRRREMTALAALQAKALRRERWGEGAEEPAAWRRKLAAVNLDARTSGAWR